MNLTENPVLLHNKEEKILAQPFAVTRFSFKKNKTSKGWTDLVFFDLTICQFLERYIHISRQLPFAPFSLPLWRGSLPLRCSSSILGFRAAQSSSAAAQDS